MPETAYPPAATATGHETLLDRIQPIPPPGQVPPPAYYDIPFLKKPVWSWEIGCYFFLGGLSAGSYLLARVAERCGGERFRPMTRAGTGLAVAALLPCPPLLIADLGDPKRFHHMLRVFKPRSPMNLGSWVLTGYSGILFLTALREWFRDEERPEGFLSRLFFVGVDAVGLPLSLFFSGYTGVLLSATATPVWTQNPWLGPLFTASAIGNGAAGIHLALEAQKAEDSEDHQRMSEVLEQIDTTTDVAEGLTLAGYFWNAGNLAEPLTTGPAAPYFWAAAASAVTSEVLRRLPVREPTRRWTRLAASVLGVASGFCLKWAMQQAGVPSAQDPEADRRSSRPRPSQGMCTTTGVVPVGRENTHEVRKAGPSQA